MSFPISKAVILFLATVFFAWVSRYALRKPRSHGFSRFFAWECILGLVLLNYPTWDNDPSALHQVASRVLMMISLVLPIHAVYLLRRRGRPSKQRSDAELYSFERTSTLVTSGAFRYIRHPMYAALLFLAWGVFIKHISAATIALVAGASVALWITALRDEAECRQHFGVAYEEYMRTTKRFIPFVF